MCLDMKAFIALLAFATICDAHGTLLRPVPRTPTGEFVEGATDPIGFNSDTVFEFPDVIGQEFVCRSGIAKDSGEIWNADQTVEIEAFFGVPHPGYCELFFSYDVDASLREMRWFKVGNWKDCGTNFDMAPGTDFPERMTSTFNVFLPSWLPQGNAVFRFMWSAMHNATPEYYVDCSDVTIQSSSSSLPASVITYPMINQSPYNEDINMWLSGDEDLDGNHWPNPQIAAEWMCGTPCAEAGASYNQCPLTASGTEGYIDISRYASSMPSTSSAPESTSSSSSLSSSDNDDDSVEQPTEGPQSTTNSVTVQPESTSGAATERPQSTNDPVQNECPSFCTRGNNWDLVCGWTGCALCDECLDALTALCQSCMSVGGGDCFVEGRTDPCMNSDRDVCINYNERGFTGRWCPDVTSGGPTDNTIPEGSSVAKATYYHSYAACCPDNPNYGPTAETTECDSYNACAYPGIFAGFSKQLSYDWVQTHNIIAFFDRNHPTYDEWLSMYAGKWIRLTKDAVTVDALIADTCGDSDCGGCCSANSHSDSGYLVDIEYETLKNAFGVDAIWGDIHFEILEGCDGGTYDGCGICNGDDTTCTPMSEMCASCAGSGDCVVEGWSNPCMNTDRDFCINYNEGGYTGTWCPDVESNQEAVTEEPNSITEEPEYYVDDSITEQPDTVPNNCPSRCTREDNWDIVCNSWSRCAACDECSTLVTSDPFIEEPASTSNSATAGLSGEITATERSESASSGTGPDENGSLRLEIAFAMFIMLTLHW